MSALVPGLVSGNGWSSQGLGATDQRWASPQSELSEAQAACLLGKGPRTLTPRKVSRARLGGGIGGEPAGEPL